MNDLDQAMREVADVEAHIAARKDAAMSIRQDLTQAAHIVSITYMSVRC